MKKRLTADEIEALAHRLELAEPEQTGWRATYNALSADFRRASSFRDSGLFVLACLTAPLYLALFFHEGVFARWSLEALHNRATEIRSEANLLALATMLVAVLWSLAVSKLFPILEREGRIAALLRYFGAGIPDEPGSGDWPLGARPGVVAALKVLETARSSAEIGSAYRTVWRWRRADAVRRDTVGVFSHLFAMAAFTPAFLIDAIGWPDFWRGVAFTAVAIFLIWRVRTVLRQVMLEFRADRVLHRWHGAAPVEREQPNA